MRMVVVRRSRSFGNIIRQLGDVDRVCGHRVSQYSSISVISAECARLTRWLVPVHNLKVQQNSICLHVSPESFDTRVLQWAWRTRQSSKF